MKNNNENRMLLKIPVEKIINSYRKIFNIDVSYLFNDIDHITLNKCKKTKYFFTLLYLTLTTDYHEISYQTRIRV